MQGSQLEKQQQPPPQNKSAAQTAMTSLCQHFEVHCIARSQKTTHSDTGTCRLPKRLNAHNRRRLAMSEMKPRLVWAAEYDDDSDYLSVMERLDTQGQNDGVTICRLHGEASADLIAEAGTVHHETGLTPRQLVEQRDALVERVKELERALQQIATSAEATYCNVAWVAKHARAALSKSLPNTVAETPK
jgi:hypothetical protein